MLLIFSMTSFLQIFLSSYIFKAFQYSFKSFPFYSLNEVFNITIMYFQFFYNNFHGKFLQMILIFSITPLIVDCNSFQKFMRYSFFVSFDFLYLIFYFCTTININLIKLWVLVTFPIQLYRNLCHRGGGPHSLRPPGIRP